MATEAQIAANRNNAQKSTGLKTPEGKDAVRLNGLIGLASGILVLPGESESDFNNLLDSLEAEHEPATPTEVILVRQMAMASWRLQRIVHMEAAHYRLSRAQLQPFYKNYYDDQLTEPERQAIIAERDSGNTLITFSRYEARLERSCHKSLTALQHLRALRKKRNWLWIATSGTSGSRGYHKRRPRSQSCNGRATFDRAPSTGKRQQATDNQQPTTAFPPQ